jgi:hypothetical protein
MNLVRVPVRDERARENEVTAALILNTGATLYMETIA